LRFWSFKRINKPSGFIVGVSTFNASVGAGVLLCISGGFWCFAAFFCSWQIVAVSDHFPFFFFVFVFLNFYALPYFGLIQPISFLGLEVLSWWRTHCQRRCNQHGQRGCLFRSRSKCHERSWKGRSFFLCKLTSPLSQVLAKEKKKRKRKRERKRKRKKKKETKKREMVRH